MNKVTFHYALNFLCEQFFLDIRSRQINVILIAFMPQSGYNNKKIRSH